MFWIKITKVQEIKLIKNLQKQKQYTLQFSFNEHALTLIP